MNIKLAAVLFLLLCFSTAQAELYRWVDDSGRVHYSDKVPPKYSKRGHEKLSKNAQKLESVRSEKTAEELELERQEAIRLKELEKVARAERARDITLLRTFGSTSDIDRVMNDRIEALQSNINLIQGKIGKVMVKLKQSEKKKASYVKEEKLVPRQLAKNIKDYRGKIDSWQGNISEYKQNQNDTYEQFRIDRLRLIELKERSATSTY